MHRSHFTKVNTSLRLKDIVIFSKKTRIAVIDSELLYIIIKTLYKKMAKKY